ncbi:NAD(P)H-flavin reductase [Ferrimonas marina]|uniref:Aquacobalamin reductase / NAD(P)H-flavin reductase n=1 Tax=Ferrimonas marina TaxID=299255 RepID=A0A1M5XX17_9GAMM|nr:NAD(P)H-flavin reductase [Ferrimonas marina]SHI04239.1 aquacobalamin reductase / NAD(P)H-flavin reductase [Ferrimonas marina]
MSRTLCHVVSVTPFTDSVFRVRLAPSMPLAFKPGQYLTIVMSDEDKRPFSIASAPHQGELELHIGAAVKEGYAMQVIERLQSSETIEIEAPFGEAYLRSDSQRPRILIAGGTGFSYIHSMMESLLEQNDNQTTFLYWGSRDSASMYARDIAEQWAKRHPKLTFVPVFDEVEGEQRQGTVIDAVCEDFVGLHDYDIYIAGRFEMAGAARERFREHGVDEAHLYGDAYAFMK